MKKILFWMLSLILLPMIIQQVLAAKAAITLIDFTANVDAGEVKIEWETASEIGNTGFYIQRSYYENNGYERITSFIPSDSPDGGQTGAYYYYFDSQVNVNLVYWYRLEAIGTNGISEFYGPKKVDNLSANPFTATPGSTLTLTPTVTPGGPTLTSTATPTPSQTPGGPTQTQTLPPTITNTLPPTNTQPPGVTPNTATPTTLSPTIDSGTAMETSPLPTLDPNAPTTTLMPLPTIELLFPAPTVTPEMAPYATEVAPVALQTLATAGPTEPLVNPVEISLRVRLLTAIVVGLWLILALFLIFYFYKASQ